MLVVCPRDTPVPNNRPPISTGGFSDRLTCSREYPAVFTLAMLLLVISIPPRSAARAPNAIPRVPKRPPMISAPLPGVRRQHGGIHRRAVRDCVVSQEIHQHGDRPA